MAEFSLFEALRECAPTIGDSSVDGVRLSAMTRLFEELHVLARRSGGGVAQAEDAASAVLLHLIESGPRGKGTGPQTDDAARGYLLRCIRNEIVDAGRRKWREASSDSEGLERRGQSQSHPQDEIDLLKDVMRETGELTLQLERASQRLFDDVVPFTTAYIREQARQDFLDAIALRCAIAEGRTTIEQCVIGTLGELNHKTRATFDKRQARALQRLGDGLEDFIQLNSVSDNEAHAMRHVLDALRNRAAFWVDPQAETKS